MKKQIIISLFLLVAFCSTPVFAQEKSKDKIIAEFKALREKILSDGESQCEMYSKPDFSGKPISITVANADIRDFLKEITKQIGVQFEVDKSVGQVFITANADNAPWNRLLNAILELRGLAVQTKCPIVRIAKSKNSKVKNFEISPLYIETITFKNLQFKESRQSDVLNFDENTKKFIRFLTKFLTFRGTVEFDFRTKTLVINDRQNRAKLISEFVKLLDESGFKLEELVNEPVFEMK
ncbi:hypothetical protein BH10ACI1_BH10ACI1_15070 [soil metagenome]